MIFVNYLPCERGDRVGDTVILSTRLRNKLPALLFFLSIGIYVGGFSGPQSGKRAVDPPDVRWVPNARKCIKWRDADV